MEPWIHSTKGARNRLTISALLQCARHTESYPPIFHYYRPIIFCNFKLHQPLGFPSILSIAFHSAYNIKRCKDFSLPPVFVRLLATLPGARSLELLQVSCALRFSTQTWPYQTRIDSVSVWRPLLFSCPLLFLFSSFWKDGQLYFVPLREIIASGHRSGVGRWPSCAARNAAACTLQNDQQTAARANY